MRPKGLEIRREPERFRSRSLYRGLFLEAGSGGAKLVAGRPGACYYGARFPISTDWESRVICKSVVFLKRVRLKDLKMA